MSTKRHEFDRNRKARFLLLAFALVIVTTLVLGFLYKRTDYPRFVFVRQSEPLEEGLADAVESRMPGSGMISAYQIYTWQEPFAPASARAESELRQKGFSRKAQSNVEISFANADGAIISVRAERKVSSYGGFYGHEPINTNWVTVYCIQPLPNSWLNRVKLFLREHLGRLHETSIRIRLTN
ncbi:MAG: hypothetical protein H7Y17_09110 [Chlorobia bacterium]|nr:hypothetical protein [Fimbriimonadaceae bacterium]